MDLGATSGRFALGNYQEGRIKFEVVEQIPHGATERNGRLEWDLDLLLSLCRRAADYGAANGAQTLGIDSWGVDHGFLDADGNLLGAPVCYRDLSHLDAFEALRPHRERLYALTGIQHQPFNTICQLYARRAEDPMFVSSAKDWMIFPDLLGYLLSGERNHELTQASTTQLLGLDGQWSAEAFEIAGWPTPERVAHQPGSLGGQVGGLRIAHVGSHDTASAVAGFGVLGADQIFLNVGTWSLVGCVIPQPIATPEAERLNFTNERTIDGQVRFLRNVPGFYVINRIHEELRVGKPVPEWLASATLPEETVDLLHPDFFNPDSMVETCAALAGRRPRSIEEWAGFALGSLTATLAKLPGDLERLTGRKFNSIRVGGGGSQSVAFCGALAQATGLTVHAGPAEATVLGNVGVQFLASGVFGSHAEMFAAISRSADVSVYAPNRR
ncbi:putative rhamnulokinase [Fimbriimonas ginsengisoli Gsoil 348]|uniref:Putative rhamnulokinase n=1 Tax=Fimbriimonas ginsengisoli Gsoil 348 TaxID=661478 RepID=A0A068NSD7_FIMGI|nr:putative rhamnulokinase [Fimbriimonas ginsengisoli Gsoil 348]